MEWITQSNKWLAVYDGTGTEFMTLRERLAKFHDEKRNILRHYHRGRQLLTQLAGVDKSSGIRDLFGKEVARMEAMIKANQGSFIGTEGKVSPFVIYVHGEPGVGKSALSDHLFHDLYAALDQREYQPSKDKYSYNALTPYFDTYDYQRVFEMQDFLQMRSPVANQLEIINLIRMGDETAYPLNMAACESKGAMFFSSDFLYITSNHEFDSLQNIVLDSIFSWQAFTRRVDVHVEMKRELGLDETGFNKYSISFNHRGKTLDYDAFIALLAREYKKKVTKSSSVSSVHAASSFERVSHIKTLLTEPAPLITCSLCAYTSQCTICRDTKPLADSVLRFRLNSGLVNGSAFRRVSESLQVECNQRICSCERCAEWRQDHLGALSGRWVICHDPEFGRSGRTKHVCSADCCRTNTYRQQIRTAAAQGGSNSDGNDSDTELIVGGLLHETLWKVAYGRAQTPEEFKIEIDAEFQRLEQASIARRVKEFNGMVQLDPLNTIDEWTPPVDCLPDYHWANLMTDPLMTEILLSIVEKSHVNVIFGDEEIIRDHAWTAVWKVDRCRWEFRKTSSSI